MATIPLCPQVDYTFADSPLLLNRFDFSTFIDDAIVSPSSAAVLADEKINMYAPKISDISPHPSPAKGEVSLSGVLLPPSVQGIHNEAPSPTVSQSDSQSIASRHDSNPRNATGAVVVFVSAEEDCDIVARMFCAKLTHHFSWLGDATRMFIVGPDEDRVLSYTAENRSLWEDSVRQLAECVAEYMTTQDVLGLAAQPVSVILGDFEQEGALLGAEKALAAAWDKVPGNPGAIPINTRYIHFGTKWREDAQQRRRSSAAISPNDPVILAKRSYVEVNLVEESVRTTRSKSGVVCSMIVSFLVQMMPLLSHVHRHEPRGCPSIETLECLPPIFFTRHGESEYNIEDRLGGDPALTAHGVEDARAVGDFFAREVKTNPTLFAQRSPSWDSEFGFEVWCSQLQRTQQTALPAAQILCNGILRPWSNLNEIHAGVCEDMTNSEVKGQYQMLHNFRKQNKVAFRYPSGESYLDLMRRLAPVIMEVQTRQKATLVVAHQAVLRTLLSYFGGPSVEEAVTSDCPHRTVWCATLDKTGCPRLCRISLPRKADNGVWEGW